MLSAIATPPFCTFHLRSLLFARQLNYQLYPRCTTCRINGTIKVIKFLWNKWIDPGPLDNLWNYGKFHRGERERERERGEKHLPSTKISLAKHRESFHPRTISPFPIVVIHLRVQTFDIKPSMKPVRCCCFAVVCRPVKSFLPCIVRTF